MTRLQAILGQAGTGKSFYLNSLIRQDRTFGLRTATTGIAALNMGTISNTEEPTTINRALRYFTTENLLSNYTKRKVFFPLKIINRKYSNIIIDEISMMNSATLDLIVMSIEHYNKETGKDLGLVICGDIGQLSPVEGSPVFNAKCWDKFDITNLTEVKRQDNKEFVEALGCIRRGEVLEALRWFETNISFVEEPDICFRGATLFSTNNEVNIFNKRRLKLLMGESKVYTSKLEGTSHVTWDNIPTAIELKKGAVIQLLYNDFDYGFANGDLAIVDELWENSIEISLLRKSKHIHLRPRKLAHYTFNTKGYLNSKPEGTLSLLHIKLAAAQTTHKVQGLSLDNVQINLKGAGKNFIKRQTGMLYTALSRVKTPEGLIIVGTPQDLVDCCYLNPSYKKWIY
jgi:ATP-dependent DNA helicase PIF1